MQRRIFPWLILRTRELKQWKEAIRPYKTTLKIFTSENGEEHEQTGTVLLFLGEAHRHSKRVEASITMLKNAFGILRRSAEKRARRRQLTKSILRIKGSDQPEFVGDYESKVDYGDV